MVFGRVESPHEEFNANSWADGHTPKVINGISVATPKPDYRYNVETYSIGGPAFIPKSGSTKKKKHLFLFWSQEYTGQFVPCCGADPVHADGARRNGDFSQSFTNSNGNPVVVKVLDPANNNAQFTNNMIPASRLNPLGQSLDELPPAAESAIARRFRRSSTSTTSPEQGSARPTRAAQ